MINTDNDSIDAKETKVEPFEMDSCAAHGVYRVHSGPK